jgi:hypothetical protein
LRTADWPGRILHRTAGFAGHFGSKKVRNQQMAVKRFFPLLDKGSKTGIVTLEIELLWLIISIGVMFK